MVSLHDDVVEHVDVVMQVVEKAGSLADFCYVISVNSSFICL